MRGVFLWRSFVAQINFMSNPIKRIVVVGASGTIGKAIVQRIEEKGHTVIRVSRSSGDFQADIQDKKSLEEVFRQIGVFDAVASAAGDVRPGALEALTDEDFYFSIRSKMMGQINLVRAALPYVADGGSFSLVSGILSDEPIAGGVIGTMVNGAVEGFVKALSYELPRSLRINCISPNVLTESTAYHAYFPGFIPVDASRVAIAFERSIFGVVNGRILKVY
jgi:NAD(P)-dependent dehydrogenase (short-subunit alcohol dehydrogenase family)